MVKMLSKFDKKSQIKFYNNLENEMRNRDLLDKYQFHPELLALKEKENIKEVVFDSSIIQQK